MRKEKKLLLDEIKHNLENNPDFFITGYKNLSANLAASFRDQTVESGGFFSSVKKSLFIKATSEMGISINLDSCKGHIGIVYGGENAINVAKTLHQFKKANQETIEVLGGKFDGALCHANEVEAIAELPSINEMKAQVLGLFEAPLASTLSVFEAVMSSSLSCIEQKIEKDNH